MDTVVAVEGPPPTACWSTPARGPMRAVLRLSHASAGVCHGNSWVAGLRPLRRGRLGPAPP